VLQRLFRDAQPGELVADLAEHRCGLRGRSHQIEAGGVLRAILQHRRGRIAAGVDLHRIDRDAGLLGIIAQDALPGVDLRGVVVPAVLGVQTVRQDDDRVLVLIVRILCRRIEGIRLATSSSPMPGRCPGSARLVGFLSG
jgi:hypothetical protein